MHIVLAASGERVLSALAIAQEFQKLVPESRITFAGQLDAVWQKHVLDSGFDYRPLTPEHGTGFGWLAAGRWAVKRAARRIVCESVNTILVGFGGDDSIAMARAAVSQRTPLVLLEQHVEPTWANRKLARDASLICLAFERTREMLDASCPIRVTGTPLPAECCSSARSTVLPRTRRLVVLADREHDALNIQVPRALRKVVAQLAQWQVIHQTGSGSAGAIRSQYERNNVRAIVASRIENISTTLACADLVISRASGTRLAAIAAAGAPAIIVSGNEPENVNRDALLLQRAGACHVVDDDGIWLGDHLVAELEKLLDDDLHRQRLSQLIRRYWHADAGWKVATMIRDLALTNGFLAA